jgi:two-component system KDP operon response regulator KdpE
MSVPSASPTSFAARTSQGKLLIVDDEPALRWALHRTLRTMGFEISEAENGDEALALVRTVRFDAVLLDIAMPGMDGVRTCLEIRKVMPQIGILMVTVKDSEADKIQALDAGADDYVTKPFNVRELAARIRSTIRRAQTMPAASTKAITIGEIELDPARRAVRRCGEIVHLTPKEFDLLHYLISHAGLSITHGRLLAAVWGPEYRDQVEYLRTFIRQLRRKLGDDAANPKYLQTDSHVGYRFRADEELARDGAA